MRERPVARPKIAVETARRRRSGTCAGGIASGDGSSSADGAPQRSGSGSHTGRPVRRRRSFRACRRARRSSFRTSSTDEEHTAHLCYPCRARRVRASFSMPNIKQQKKRVRIAAEERLENLQYRSTIKTLTKRLQAAASEGDDETVAAERRSLEQLIDRAVSRGALHRSAGARKKAQAARIVAGPEA